MNRRRSVITTAALAACITAATLAPVVSTPNTTPVATADAHTFNHLQLCGAFYDGRKSIQHFGYAGYYSTSTRLSGGRYSVTYVFYRYIVQGPPHFHTTTCAAP